MPTPSSLQIARACCIFALGGIAFGCTNSNVGRSAPSGIDLGAPAQVVTLSDIEWGYLNPARGDASPGAGALWGDRTKPGASGFLVEFAKGFSSPPHIHNVSYRGIVIRGLVHNDDPGAASMWMPAGSYWTQPAGEAHITAASDDRNLAYIEIDDGPYLVHPTAQAFDNGERPINVDPTNLVWQSAANIADGEPERTMAALLWGTPERGSPHGVLLKFQSGFDGWISSDSEHRAVVVSGQLVYSDPGGAPSRALPPGSAFGADLGSEHHIASSADEASIIYVRTDGALQIITTPSRSDHE